MLVDTRNNCMWQLYWHSFHTNENISSGREKRNIRIHGKENEEEKT